MASKYEVAESQENPSKQTLSAPSLVFSAKRFFYLLTASCFINSTSCQQETNTPEKALPFWMTEIYSLMLLPRVLHSLSYQGPKMFQSPLCTPKPECLCELVAAIRNTADF